MTAPTKVLEQTLPCIVHIGEISGTEVGGRWYIPYEVIHAGLHRLVQFCIASAALLVLWKSNGTVVTHPFPCFAERFLCPPMPVTVVLFHCF